MNKKNRPDVMDNANSMMPRDKSGVVNDKYERSCPAEKSVPGQQPTSKGQVKH
jgi:hypothetical protein